MDSSITLQSHGPALSRRTFLIGSLSVGGAALLAGCAPLGSGVMTDVYGAMPNERYPIPPVDISGVDPGLLRQVVRYETTEAVGTIVIDLPNYHLYRVDGEGMATRYGVNGPREPFLWSGIADIGRKAEWPIWTPTRDQIGRDPSLIEHAGGMAPGLSNPLGSRALYLYQDGRDTICRIYGTDQAWTLGQGVSSGCVGLLNQDVIDLYNRTAVGTKVILIQA